MENNETKYKMTIEIGFIFPSIKKKINQNMEIKCFQ